MVVTYFLLECFATQWQDPAQNVGTGVETGGCDVIQGEFSEVG